AAAATWNYLKTVENYRKSTWAAASGDGSSRPFSTLYLQVRALSIAGLGVFPPLEIAVPKCRPSGHLGRQRVRRPEKSCLSGRLDRAAPARRATSRRAGCHAAKRLHDGGAGRCRALSSPILRRS